ncbi:MAG TPA: SDR family NAD(P)-dependent oxidoreductase [Mariniphaga sp.]|nr:SDR family NAD(P)-dependent oxidoreductase [Mariniphaga sp.]
MMQKTVLITGATSGIGKATSILLAKNGFNLILTGRRQDRLVELKQQLEAETQAQVLTLNFDIRNQDATEKAISSLPDEWQKIDILINNAGLAVGLSGINDGTTDDWERMIDTNVKGLLYISKIISAKMIDAGGGHIVNISSIAGKETYPMGNVYCATKHAVQAITKGMRLDFLKHGIKVTAVCPGAVNTEFSLVRFKGDAQKADKVYEGITPLFADDIAETILFVVTRPAHVNVDDILIMPTDQAYSRDFNRK